MALQPNDFDAFHRAVHGAERGAFDWQKRLLDQVVERRQWPHTLDLPTGAGKTTCVDIALFALALDAQRPKAQRWCPRRIAMVVDRRVVVDQVAERGRKLAAALADPKGPTVVSEVARALRSLCANSDGQLEPVGVFTLRGGVPKDDGWARSPDQPLILASTVDQLGSRLLVQGYGVSRSMRPVHAGLIGNDTLVLLDEVHLSQPFAETLQALPTLRKHSQSKRLVPARFQVAFLSATPGQQLEDSFSLTAAERTKDAPLGPRLYAHKPVSLEEVDGRDRLEERCAKRARELITKHAVIAVVVNRVRSAAQIVEQLKQGNPDFDVSLLTGRMRPLDRDEVLRELRSRIETGRVRANAIRRLIVVGTQCIEAGADFDFDAMVTEGASLDALRQRFGRVDRLGQYEHAEGVIVFDKSLKKDDPVYGKASAETLGWLRTQLDKKTKTIDFGIAHLSLPNGAQLTATLAPKESAPVLLPAYMDLWVQTSPEPAEVPEPALWLHGPRSGPPDVQVIWRIDLTERMLAEGTPSTVATNVVAAVRPSALEAMTLPFVAAQAWLAGAESAEISDVEGVGQSDRLTLGEGGRYLRWRGERSEVCEAKELRPGDTIIVPATRGGMRHKCFEATAREPVSDLAELASLQGRGQPVLRRHPAVLKELDLGELTMEDTSDARDALHGLADQASGWRRVWLQRLADGRTRTIVVEDLDAGQWTVLQGARLSAAELRAILDPSSTQEDGVELTTDEEDSYFTGRSVSLSEHSADVEHNARAFADALGLSDSLVEDLALAGWLHDIGKADRRFQIMLRGGSEIDWRKDETLWAKSAMSSCDKAAQRRAQARSGYPAGTRHEVQSPAMIDRHLEWVQGKAHDIELVRFLVASHHGHCRPFAPPVSDSTPVSVQIEAHESERFGTLRLEPVSSDNRLYCLDSQLAERFWNLVAKYGWLELCWLEAILRLADHRASEAEQLKGESA